jgi:two-component system cell cycle response regulator DivK
MEAARILVIEDDPRSMILFTFILHGNGYDVQKAINGREALAILEWFAANIIVLDLHLPDVHGLPLVRRLRDDPRTAAIPIVAVTAYAVEDDAGRAFAAGVDAYLTKPVEKARLLETIAQQLARTAPRAERA